MLIDFFHAASSGNAWLSIADAIVKATILLAAAAISAYALRGASAAARHLVWTLALLSALVLPALSMALPRWQLPIVTLSSTEMAPATPKRRRSSERACYRGLRCAQRPSPLRAVGIQQFRLPPAEGQVSRVAFPNISWPAALLLLWAAGALMILGRLACRSHRGPVDVAPHATRNERRRRTLALAGAGSWRPDSGSRRASCSFEAQQPAMPMAWGILRPSVLMPADADGWPAERLRIVLLHELAHVKRRDCLTHLLAQ